MLPLTCNGGTKIGYHTQCTLCAKALLILWLYAKGIPEIFNKASLMNAGFLEARKLDSYDCFIFHDVDMLSEDDRNMYTCMNKTRPRHIGAYVEKNNYT